MATVSKTGATSPTPATRRGRKPKTGHDARLEFRLSSEAKAKIERAALVSGQSVSDFAASTLVREAAEVLAAYETTTLSDRDRDLFLALLDSDEGPNEALQAAFAHYQEGQVVGGRYILPGESDSATPNDTETKKGTP